MRQDEFIMKNKTNKKDKWKSDETEFIIMSYGIMTAEEIAKALGRTVSSVRSFITKQKIRKKSYASLPSNYKNEKETLCWTCKWSTNPKGNKCTWSKNFIPVKGWNAKKTLLELYSPRGLFESYIVKECPLYERDSNMNCDDAFCEYAEFVDEFKKSIL